MTLRFAVAQHWRSNNIIMYTKPKLMYLLWPMQQVIFLNIRKLMNWYSRTFIWKS